MSEQLKTGHPLLMVPHVFSFSVVLYTNGGVPDCPVDELRKALINALPPGTGVGGISAAYHGIYDHKKGGAA